MRADSWFPRLSCCILRACEREGHLDSLSLKSTNPILRLLFHDHAQPLPLKDTTSSCNLLGGEGFSTGVNLIIVGLSFLVPASWGCGRDYCQQFLQLPRWTAATHPTPRRLLSSYQHLAVLCNEEACTSILFWWQDKQWLSHSFPFLSSLSLHPSFFFYFELWPLMFQKKPPRFGNSTQHSLSSWEQHTRASYRKG